MSEIAIRESGALDFPTSAPPATSKLDRLVAWADSARAAHQVAVSLVQTSFVPEAFRGKAHEATAAILAGAEVGLDPMASLRSFDVINGTAAPRAMTLRAVLQSRGHQIWVKESTATRAIVEGIRFGETRTHQSVWTIDRAQKLGLTNKSNWKNQPQAMLIARATAECARLVASDAILGIPYASEELDDDGPVSAPPAEVKPARRTAKRAAIEPPPEPELEPEPTLEEAVEEEAQKAPGAMITDKQSKKLHAQLRELGKGSRDDGLAEISRIVGEPIESSKVLTADEAGRVIDDLEAQLLAAKAPAEPDLDDWPDTAQPPDGAP